jgi:hypothetical protein
MFEEVPGDRPRYARMLGRRLVLGPFVIGTGVLLATIGGSVAVAATVITASNGGFNDIPPKLLGHSAALRIQPPAAPAATHSGSHHSMPRTPAAAASATVSPVVAGSAGANSRAIGGPVVGGPVLVVEPVAPTPPWRSESGTVVAATPSSAPTSVGAAPVASSPAPSAVPSSTASSAPAGDPAGNALIYVSGYDATTGRIQYAFAILQGSAEAGGAQRYQVSGPAQFSASIAPSIRIGSGGTICPASAAGCTPEQLIAAASRGFFAEVAIDSSGQLRSVLEVGDAQAGARFGPAPSRSPVPSPSGSGTPVPSETTTPPSQSGPTG